MIWSTVSSPIRSARARGPIGWFIPNFIIPSIASGSATPSCRVSIASLIMGQRILLLTKPGESLHSSGVLPILSDAPRTAAVTSGSVSLPLMISMSFIIGTGFMKCIPITLSGLLVWLAISFIEMLDVLLASMASCLQMESSSENVENFRSGISGIASTTKSALDAEALSVDEEINERALDDSSSDILPLETSLPNDEEIVSMPLSTNSWLISIITTS